MNRFAFLTQIKGVSQYMYSNDEEPFIRLWLYAHGFARHPEDV